MLVFYIPTFEAVVAVFTAPDPEKDPVPEPRHAETRPRPQSNPMPTYSHKSGMWDLWLSAEPQRQAAGGAWGRALPAGKNHYVHVLTDSR